MSSFSRFADRAVGAFWRRVANATRVSPSSLGVFRWLYGLYFLALEAPSFGFIDHAPRAFFEPPVLSLAFSFDGFPPAPFFRVLDLLSVASLALVTVGFYTRTSTALLLFLKLVGSNFHYSFGKIDHDILSLAVLGCMLFGDWGRFHSLDARRRKDKRDQDPTRRERGSALLGVLLAFGMFSAGLPKALVWIDFDLRTSGTLSWYYPNRVALGRELLLAPYLERLPLVVLELGDYLAPLLELGAFVALLWSRRAWLSWLLLASCFHLVNALLLNINFMSYAVIYCGFANLERYAALLERWKLPLLALTAVMTAFHSMTRSLWVGSPVLFAAGPLETELAALWSTVPVFFVVLWLLGQSVFSPRAGNASSSG